MFTKLRSILSRRNRARNITCEPVRLAIEGIAPAPLTPEPDEAELAAEAFLNSKIKIKDSSSAVRKAAPKGSKEYFQQLSVKIREAQAAEARSAMRYISHTEQCLQTAASSDEPGGSLAELESGLFKHQNAAQRAKGELLRRWQRCMAEVTVREMQKYKLSTNNAQ